MSTDRDLLAIEFQQDAICSKCGKIIKKGENGWWLRAEKVNRGGLFHTDCKPEFNEDGSFNKEGWAKAERRNLPCTIELQQDVICCKCGKPIEKGKDALWVRTTPKFQGGLFHTTCEPEFNEDGTLKRPPRKIPNKKKRESQIRKELRENKECYRGTCLVTRHPDMTYYEVKRFFGCGDNTSYTETVLDRLVTKLLGIEDDTIDGVPLPRGGGKCRCIVCLIKENCKDQGPTPCEKFRVKPPRTDVQEPLSLGYDPKYFKLPEKPDPGFITRANFTALREAVDAHAEFHKKLEALATEAENLSFNNCTVTIKDYPPHSKIAAIKALRRVTDWGLKEAKDAIDSGIAFKGPLAEANKVVKALNEAGVAVHVKEM